MKCIVVAISSYRCRICKLERLPTKVATMLPLSHDFIVINSLAGLLFVELVLEDTNFVGKRFEFVIKC